MTFVTALGAGSRRTKRAVQGPGITRGRAGAALRTLATTPSPAVAAAGPAAMAPPLAVFGCPGRYVQGRDATKQLGEMLVKNGLQGPIILVASNVRRPPAPCRCGSGAPLLTPCRPPPPPQSASRLLSATWDASLAAAGIAYSVHKFGGESTAAEIEAIAAAGRAAGAKSVVGCGGGKVGGVGAGRQGWDAGGSALHGRSRAELMAADCRRRCRRFWMPQRLPPTSWAPRCALRCLGTLAQPAAAVLARRAVCLPARHPPAVGVPRRWRAARRWLRQMRPAARSAWCILRRGWWIISAITSE